MIKVKEHRYCGYLQGYKVIIDGIKFPLKRGYFYTNMSASDAEMVAKADYRLMAFNNRFKVASS